MRSLTRELTPRPPLGKAPASLQRRSGIPHTIIRRLLPDEDVIVEDASVGHDVAVNTCYVRLSAAGVVAPSVDRSSAWWTFASS